MAEQSVYWDQCPKVGIAYALGHGVIPSGSHLAMVEVVFPTGGPGG